ncbi:MAG: hypothetical protein K8R21_08490 [Leptospira sp.]|nr:hypothetical protein [Leptospira sp.]
MNFDAVDMSKDLHSSLGFEKLTFGRFSEDEIMEMLIASGIFKVLESRGYKNYRLEVSPLSELDNRIFIKTKEDEILVHMRLKTSDFTYKKSGENFRMVYIDWLLTQNIHYGTLPSKRKLFEGQKYPGLSVMNEITDFILQLTGKMGAHGVFNIPEYFHDAVLFQKKFQFVDPEKEGIFRNLLEAFRKFNLRDLSHLIHNNGIINERTGEIYAWQYGEMIAPLDEYMRKLIFNKEYFESVSRAKLNFKFSRVES